MDVGTQSRTARRTAATRRAIIDAGEALLTEGGPDALTLEAVSERADVAVQTIYNRVGSRSALLIAIAERAFEEHHQQLEAILAAAGTLEERIRLGAAAYARFAAERPHQFRLIVDPPPEPDALERVGDLIAEQHNKLAAVLRDGIADGTINPNIDPDLTVAAVWATLNGILSLAWRSDRLRANPQHLSDLLATVTAILRDGLAPRNE
jgi:AcrR family transcriptional regulator